MNNRLRVKEPSGSPSRGSREISTPAESLLPSGILEKNILQTIYKHRFIRHGEKAERSRARVSSRIKHVA